MAKHVDNRCPAVRLADEMNRKAKELLVTTKRRQEAHQLNLKAMRKVANALKGVVKNFDNIIQPHDVGTLDWCINVLNNPED